MEKKKKKKKCEEEYFRRINKILRLKLNSGNVATPINSRAVAVIRYSAGLIKRTKKIKSNRQKKQEKITIRRALHPQADFDGLYIPSNNGGRGMISVEDSVEIETESLKKYIENRNERLLKPVEREEFLGY